MLPVNAKATCRIAVGSHCLDLPLLGSRNRNLLVALVAAVALLVATASSIYLSRTWTEQNAATAVPSVELSAPRVPAQPVNSLERVDLSTVVSNPTNRSIDRVTLEMSVLQSDGTRVMSSRQGGLALQPRDSRAVYWSWRVPGQLATGEYRVEVRAFDGNGQPLSGEEPSSRTLYVVGRQQ